MRSYYILWFLGILISLFGVFLVKKIPAGLGNSAGYILAFIGLSIIAYAINRKNKIN